VKFDKVIARLHQQGMNWPMRRLLAALIMMLFSASTLAENASEEKQASDELQWQIMFELALVHDPTILEVAELDSVWSFIGGGLYLDLSYKGFFIQTNRYRANTFAGEFGYQLIERENWGLDLVSKVYLPGFDPEAIQSYNKKKTPDFEKLNERNIGAGFALRYSHYTDKDLFTADLATLNPSFGNNSWLVDLYYSHLSIYQNWDIYTGAGLTYYSRDVVNYYVGVIPEESSENFAVYQPGDGFKAEAQVFGLYPLSKSWTLSLGVTQSYYSSSFNASPVGFRQNITQLKLGVRYVL